MITEYGQEVECPKDNFIYGDIQLINSNIVFKGKGNILISEGSSKLRNSNISFCGDNAVLFLTGDGKRDYILKLDLWRETTTYFGKDNYYNGPLNAIISERKNLFVGSGGVFSFGIWLRTADPHLIYSNDTHKRTNPSKSIVIGDHVWLGQNAMILKGTTIGSGSIVSACCVLAGKTIPSNTVFAGNPGKLIKENIFFIGDSVHNYTKAKTKKSMERPGDDYIYTGEGRPLDLNSIDTALANAGSAEERLNIIKQQIACNTDKDRFFVGSDNTAKKRMRFFK